MSYWEIRPNPPLTGSIHEAAQCQDCNSELSIRAIDGNVIEATVTHDDSCPWLKGLEKRATE